MKKYGGVDVEIYICILSASRPGRFIHRIGGWLGPRTRAAYSKFKAIKRLPPEDKVPRLSCSFPTCWQLICGFMPVAYHLAVTSLIWHHKLPDNEFCQLANSWEATGPETTVLGWDLWLPSLHTSGQVTGDRLKSINQSISLSPHTHTHTHTGTSVPLFLATLHSQHRSKNTASTWKTDTRGLFWCAVLQWR
jgi:hypothetical protein